MTRPMLLTLSVAAAVAVPALAAPGPAPTRSASQIVCQLTGDCLGDAGGAQASLPSEAAFSFTRSKPRQADPQAARNKAMKVTRTERAKGRPALIAGGIDMRISFANGSAELTPQARAEATQFAKAMAAPQLAGRRFAVEGHTNAVGDRAYNLDLSQRRAAAVAAYLEAQGVEQGRLEARGVGFDQPLPGVEAAAASNRRVQFVPLG